MFTRWVMVTGLLSLASLVSLLPPGVMRWKRAVLLWVVSSGVVLGLVPLSTSLHPHSTAHHSLSDFSLLHAYLVDTIIQFIFCLIMAP